MSIRYVDVPPAWIECHIQTIPDRRPPFIHKIFPDQILKGGINRPTPAKPADVIRLEGKSHRTKKELRQRKQAEENLLTGKKLKEKAEVKNNEIAHREFLRLKKLLKEIGKDDDLYSGAINRYCLIFAECAEFEGQREKIFRRQQELEEKAGEIQAITQNLKLLDISFKHLLE